MENFFRFPPQQLSFKSKGKKWRKQCVDWGDSKTKFNHDLIRNTYRHKKVNYDLANGKLHMDDVVKLLNPENIQASYIPENIQHYPVMNKYLRLLEGEEGRRLFDFRVMITNPSAVSEIADAKRQELVERLTSIIADPNITNQEDMMKAAQESADYMIYSWQDMREIRANMLLNHYMKEQNFPLIFNSGFIDAEIVAEEIYQCDIVGGEPTLTKLDPLKVEIYKSGFSNKIEDADMIVIKDYWNPGRIVDYFYDVLSEDDRKYIESIPDNDGNTSVDEMGNIDFRSSFINPANLAEAITIEGDVYNTELMMVNQPNKIDFDMPYDFNGNIRVMRVYWKSRRKIKKIKTYNIDTNEEEYEFYPENYIIDEDLGEEEEVYWINEAWEGTKIGKDIYVNMRPRLVQYNRLSNPSRCHFGIIGSIYNINEDRPFSVVDTMKPYVYLYDVIQDRLNKLIARNWGMMTRLDLSKVPAGWTIEQWMHYAKNMGLVVEDSFNEGTHGVATGKIAGAMNNATTGVINADFGNNITQYINLLQYIKQEMGEVVGISDQRLGQIDNRETVGGVERSNLQSSHITEWLFFTHEDVKKRVLECFIETAKIALRGKNKKFHYILPDYSIKMCEIDGDEFAECDYGLVVSNDSNNQILNQKLDMLAQAALQNQILNFSSVMKLYSSCSLSEKQKMIEIEERKKMQEVQQQQQQEMQMQQQIQQMEMQRSQQEQQMKDMLNQRDNETKIAVAQINAQAEAQRFEMMNIGGDLENEQANIQIKKDELMEKMRQFDEKIKLERDKLSINRDQLNEIKRSNQSNENLKQKQINKQSKAVSK